MGIRWWRRRRDDDEPTETADGLSEEQLSRRSRSQEIVRDFDVAINEHLPVLESEKDTLRRTTDEVVNRAVALMVVAIKGEAESSGHRLTADETAQLRDEFDLNVCFSPSEAAYFDSTDVDHLTAVQFIWRYEACWVMHWALGIEDSLSLPPSPCDAATTVRHISAGGLESYRDAARLRPQSELLDAADLVYRQHWAIRNAQLTGAPFDQLEASVVMERHYALNWLIGDADDWDDVTTDT